MLKIASKSTFYIAQSFHMTYIESLPAGERKVYAALNMLIPDVCVLIIVVL